MVFCVLAGALAMFAWNRWRYDIVALLALLVVTLAGVVPPSQVFAGFGHPAVITVAAVLVLSRGLLNAGVVDSIARHLGRVGNRTVVQVAALTGLVALCSGFMNNVGALALLMPVSIALSRRKGSPPSLLLMPLAFGSLLGGMVTLMGTPPNIIIATYRAETGAGPFRMFDYLPVGGGVALVGLLFISLVGWRLVPRRQKAAPPDKLFQISDYITEVRIREGSEFAGRSLHDLVAAVEEEAEVIVLGLFHDRQPHPAPPMYEVLHAGDILLVEADSESLRVLINIADAELVAGASGTDTSDERAVEELSLTEVIVTQESELAGRRATALELREHYGVNVVAVARRGGQLRERIDKVRFAVGDILLLQVSGETLGAACSELGCLPLADRGLRLRRPRRMLLAVAIFAAALALAALGVVPAATALVGGALAMVLVGTIRPRETYESIDLPIIVLLGAMIPVGEALTTSGGAQLIAGWLAQVAHSTSPAAMLAILVAATLLLSNVVNNAAAAILVAPIAIDLAKAIDCSADPFLMAVAIGASAAFLTPIGHQSNLLVMAPGGYRFGDYWRMGLPLSVLVVVTAVPLILWTWPLAPP